MWDVARQTVEHTFMHHLDKVQAVAWNKLERIQSHIIFHTLVCTAQVWDVARQTVEHTFTHHADKVQAVAWNPVETPVLLTGGFDKQAALVSGLSFLFGGDPQSRIQIKL